MLAMWLSMVGAFAQSPEEALYDQGVRFYQSGDYDSAIRLWQQAYALMPSPALLHNIAKAYEEANQPAKALAAWRSYREVATGEEIATVTARIAELELIVAALEPAEPAPEPVVTVPVPEPVVEPPPERKPLRLSRGWVAGIMGVGAAGSVVAGSWLAQSSAGDATGLAESGCFELSGSTLCNEATTDGLRAEKTWMVAGVGLAVGGVALGTGSVLVAVTKPAASDSVMLQLDGSF